MNNIKEINLLSEIPPVHVLIDTGIKNNKPADVTLHELASRCGMLRPHAKAASPAMSMLRVGKMRLPMDKIIVVADELKIDRRKLFISLLRENVSTLIIKDDTDKERKEFARVWGALSSILAHTHNDEEGLFVDALREVQDEIGQEISPDKETIEGFKNMLRDQYAL